MDLWGGLRSRTTGEPWERDTMVLVHSAVLGGCCGTEARHLRALRDACAA